MNPPEAPGRPSGWAPATEPPLSQLQGRPLGAASLVVLLGPQSRYGARYFQVFLQSQEGVLRQAPRQARDDAQDGALSLRPVLLGLHSSGPYPAYNWIEVIAFFPQPGPSPALASDGLAQALLGYLAELIPPGGHLMVEYDSPAQEETAQGLAQGVPAAATPLGYLLFSVGCGASFKDWYFAEGGSEGPRKLQGNKALNAEHARRQTERLAQELRAFLAPAGVLRQGFDRLSPAAQDTSPSELVARAQQRARQVLAELERRFLGSGDSAR